MACEYHIAPIYGMVNREGIRSNESHNSYLKIISTAKEGGTVINYSDRFTVTGMTGTTTASIKNAVTALGGSTAGPATVNNVAANANPSAVASAPAVGGAAYNVPYNQQQGLTRYAPMQGVPPTKITQKKATPLYPTSAFKIAKNWLPQPSIVTTLTEPQTFSVHSHQNTVCQRQSHALCQSWMLTLRQAAAQSNPTGDMAKFLARWKD